MTVVGVGAVPTDVMHVVVDDRDVVHPAAVKIESVIMKIPELESLDPDVPDPGVEEPPHETLGTAIQNSPPPVLG